MLLVGRVWLGYGCCYSWNASYFRREKNDSALLIAGCKDGVRVPMWFVCAPCWRKGRIDIFLLLLLLLLLSLTMISYAFIAVSRVVLGELERGSFRTTLFEPHRVKSTNKGVNER